MGGRGRDRRIPEFKDSLVYKEKPCLREKKEGRNEGKWSDSCALLSPTIANRSKTLANTAILRFSKKATSDTKNTACCLVPTDSYSMWASCTAWTTQKEGHGEKTSPENSSSHLSAIAKSQKSYWLTGNLPNSQQLLWYPWHPLQECLCSQTIKSHVR